jgi:hypothetical protein
MEASNMKRRATSILFAVVSSGSAVAVADSPPPEPEKVEPRRLASGAPACGNVMFKTYGPPPPCVNAKVILTGIIEDAAQIRRALAVFDVWSDRPLTVVEARRLRS